MNRDPSAAIESTVDWPVTVRLRKMDAEAVWYVNRTVCALLLMLLMPMMNAPSGVRISLPRNVVIGLVRVTAGKLVGVGEGGENCIVVNCCPVEAAWSNRYRDVIDVAVLEPSTVTSARPSAPTSTPSGLAGRLTVWMTCKRVRSMTLSEALALLLTYR